MKLVYTILEGNLIGKDKSSAKDENEKEQSIFYLELEGFKTAFSDYTDIKKYRKDMEESMNYSMKKN